MTTEKDEFMTQDELAKRWRISVQTLYLWRKAGKGPPFIQIGGRPLYRRADVLEYEENILQNKK